MATTAYPRAARVNRRRERRATARSALRALALLLLLLAPWLPWLWHKVYSWLSATAVPALDKYHWLWPVVILLVLLPPISTIGDLIARRRSPARR